MTSGLRPDTAGGRSVSAPSRAEMLAIQESALAVVWPGVESMPAADALAVLEAGKAQYEAMEALVLSSRLESGASPRSVERLLHTSGRTSKRTAKKRARRAVAVRRNPTIAKKMKAGELSPDQADVLAIGADRTDGAAADDEELIEKVATTPPDQGRKIVDEWVREHTSNDRVQDRHDRQRRLRCVKRWSTDRGTEVLALEGDTASLDRVELGIRKRSDELYRADGGRDLPAGEHPRTRDQRNFDAAIELLTGTAAIVNEGEAVGGAGRPSRPPGSATSGPRSTIVVTMTAEQATGADPSPVQQVDGGLVPPTVLAQMFCGADLVGEVVDRSGMPLWLGRTTRFFSKAQVLALIARDGGCVLCGAHYSRCDAHHVIPWESPARGPTDIDNGALVCSDCHHWLHDRDLVLVRDPTSGTWSTRAAHERERAPRRRPAEPERPQADRRSARSRRTERGRPKRHERPRTGALW